MNKTLVVDGQIFQTAAWHRGMGKYSWELMKAITRKSLDSPYESLIIVLNSNLSIPDGFEKLVEVELRNTELYYIDLLLSAPGGKQAESIIENSRRLGVALGAKRLHKAPFIVLSPFSDGIAPALSPQSTAKSVLLYDLIPLMFHNRYIKQIDYDNYLARIKLFYDADVVLSISNTVKIDIEEILGLPEDRIFNINGSFIDHDAAKSEKPGLIEDYKYILMPTGDELRKNNMRAFCAFENYRLRTNSQLKLVVTSFFSENTIKEALLISDHILFTGNIPGAQLKWLYENAECLLFPSEYEGLGLPILEGVRAQLKICCSDIGIFNEISNEEFYKFDPLNIGAITEKLETCLSDGAITEKTKKAYSNILEYYTWANSAKKVINALEQSFSLNTIVSKPTLAILTPRFDGLSAIGKLVAEMHYKLSQKFDVTYYIDEGPNHRSVRPNFLEYVAKICAINEFKEETTRNYDCIIYHIGNSEYHMRTVLRSLLYPGVVIMHDTNLTSVYENLTQCGAISKRRQDAEAILTKISKTTTGKNLVSIVNRQLAAIVHSEHAKKAIISNLVGRSGLLIEKVNLPITATRLSHKYIYNRKIKIGLLVFIDDIKSLDLIEKAAHIADFINCEFYLFEAEKGALNKQIHQMSNVNILQNLTDYEIKKYMSSLDILINYHEIYQDETSLATCEAMNRGVVVLVRNTGWYSELPDKTVVKLNSRNEIFEALRNFVQSPSLLGLIGENANNEIAMHFTQDKYVDAISRIVSRLKEQYNQ